MTLFFPRKGPANDQDNRATPPTSSSTPQSDPTFLSTLHSLQYQNWFVTEYAVVFVLGAMSGLGGMAAWRRWGMRLRSSDWVTPNVFARRRWVRGVVTSVGDADNFRLYHTPGFGWRWPLKFRRVPRGLKDLKHETLHIRIAGVDAPEGSHFGRPAQPYAEESLTWLRDRIEGKTVYCQLIRRDQYGRIVAVPVIPRRFLPLFLAKTYGSPLAFEMLRAGVGTTYTQFGAEHGPWGTEAFLRLEEEARAAKRGMWKDGVNIETPGEYKKRYAVALGVSATTSIPTNGISKNDGTSGIVRTTTLLARYAVALGLSPPEDISEDSGPRNRNKRPSWGWWR